jgi:hypothetical protein
MKIHKYVIAFGLLWLGLVQAHAEPLDVFLRDYQTLTLKERAVRLEKDIETSSDNNRETLRMLLADAKYEIAKRKIASQMLSIAESRAASLPDGDRDTFSGKTLRYDILSILQSVPLAWLTNQEREQALSLSIQIENDLRTVESTDSDPVVSIDDIIAMVNEALEQARQEDLSLISEAKPNGSLKNALQKCETAREALMAQSADWAYSSRARWEAAMLSLSKAVSVLKQRQALKYALWAEGRFRESDPTNVSRNLHDTEAIALYKRLSEVNVSLVTEPSLAREITKRLYELYDRMDTQKSKEYVRYDAIISLEKRKSLDDF